MSYKKNKKFVFGTIVLTFAFAMQLVSPVITSAQIGFDKIPKRLFKFFVEQVS